MGGSSFAETLRRRRREAGLRQSDVAQRIGMGRSTVANVETGREQPSARLLAALDEQFPGWSGDLKFALVRDRAGVDRDRAAPDALPALGGPFVIESLAYVYVFEHSRSPSEILEVRRVRATEDGPSTFVLSLRHTRAPGFATEEQSLWGGHLTHSELHDEADGTHYLRTFEFSRTLRRGDRHEFATRQLVERDPDPQTEINFAVTLPVEEAHIHLAFHGTQAPEQLWSFGPVADEPDHPRKPTRTTIPLRGGTASAYFKRPRSGPLYGIAWRWPDEVRA